MAVIKGKDGTVQLGATPTAVGQIRDFAINHSAAELDASVMGTDWTDHETGQQSWDGTMTVLFDPDDTGQSEIVLDGTKVAAEFLPNGTETGEPEWTGNVIFTGANLTSARDGLVEYAITFKGTGELTKGTVSA